MILYSELAEYYYEIEKHHRDFRDDISLIISKTGGKEELRILDLGCGTGEHMNELSRRGFKCLGIDSSDQMLGIARKRFPDSGKFIHMEMEDLDYYEDFDIAYSLFGTLNYIIEDDRLDRVFWNIWRALKGGGTAILEVWNSVPVERIGEKTKSHISSTKLNDVTIDRYRGFHIMGKSLRTIVEVNYTYTLTRKEVKKELADRHIMRAFSKKEIESVLTANGFNIRGIYANSRKDDYRETSNRMIILADKP